MFIKRAPEVRSAPGNGQVRADVLKYHKKRGGKSVSTLGNILWFICGGFLGGLMWWLSGLIWCITIIGIPYGRQCFKFASLAFFPFGKEVVYGGGVPSLIANIIWVIFFGVEMALIYFFAAVIFCATIVGIPFGRQFFKLAKLSFMPFGARVI